MDMNELDLHTAVIDGSYNEIEACLRNGQGCKLPNENGLSPIHLAAMRGRNDADDVIDLLVRHGADVNLSSISDDSTALHLAVRYTELMRAENIILKLLQHGADTDVRDRSLRRPYDYALERGYVELAEKLAGNQPIDHVIQQLKKSKEQYYGEKLIRSVIDGDEDWFNVAVTKANVNQVHTHGACAIHYAITLCPLNKLEVLQKLLGANANVNALTYENDTALNLAIKTASLRENNEMYPLAQKLLESGADVGIKDLDGKDALALAEEREYDDILSLLRSPESKTPLVQHQFSIATNEDASPPDHDSNDNLISSELETINESPEPVEEDSPQDILIRSILDGTPNEVNAALQGDIDFDEYNDDGYKPIHLTVCRKQSTGKKEIIQLLLNNGCNPNSRTVPGKKTALHMAAEKDDYISAKALKDFGRGLDFNAKNQAGKTAHNIAASRTPVNHDMLLLLATTNKKPDAPKPKPEPQSPPPPPVEEPKPKKNKTCSVM